MATITTASLKPKAPRKRKAPPVARAPRRAGDQGPRERMPAKGSTMAAVLTVLDRAGEPMHHSEITAKILRYKMAPGLQGATPGDTIKAQLSMAAKHGRHGITKTAPGTFARPHASAGE